MDLSHPSDVAFTPSVKSVQERKGSRPAYARMEQRGGWQSRITPDLAQFIAAQTSVFLATVNADGQPYIQHRGGPPGFLRVLNENTIAFADFAGNLSRQRTQELARDTNKKGQVLVIDIEGWHIDPRSYPADVVDKSIYDFNTVIGWIRQAAPDLKIGMFDFFPLWRPWNPDDASAMQAWRSANDAI